MSCPEIIDKNEMIHFTKINIFGDSGVGKSTLISCLENYNNNEFVLKNDSFNEKEEDNHKDSYNNSSSIVEQIKRIKCNLQEKIELNLNIYETNLNRYNTIQMNLDTLLVQTECIIIMWDNNDPDTFENIPKLVDTIESGIKSRKFRNVPIFLIQNKSDLEINKSQASDSSMNSKKNNNKKNIETTIENLKKDYPNISHQKMSLFNNDDYPFLLLDIHRNINDVDNQNNNSEVIDFVKYKYPFTKKDDNINNNNDVLTITLLGSIATGKTSFIYNLDNKNILDVKTTIGIDNFQMLGEVCKENKIINILDTMGQEKYKSLSSDVYKKASGFLLFFDVTNRESFDEIDYYIDTIENYNGSKEIILLGNKIDDNEKRIVKKQEAKDKADQFGIKYFEISCLNGINVIEVLNEIILMSYKKFKKNEGEDNSPKKTIDNLDNNMCRYCSICC